MLATASKTAYVLGENVQIELSFRNLSSEPIQLEPFPPPVTIVRSESGELIRSFPAGAESKSLESGEEVIYTLTWDQRDDQQQQVAYGYYRVVVNTNFGTCEYLVIQILPPEGGAG
jgi:hypothetical protein